MQLSEIVEQFTCRLVALVAVFPEHPHDNLFEGNRYVRVQRTQRRRLVSQVCAPDLPRLVTLEWAAAREHLVEHDAERVDVCARVERLTTRLLRRHVTGRARVRACFCFVRLRRVGRGERRRRELFIEQRDTEVEDLDVAVVAQHYVFGLDVAVHDPRLVRGGERARRLRGDIDGLAGGQASPAQLLAQ